jgi:hypothetical protein
MVGGLRRMNIGAEVVLKWVAKSSKTMLGACDVVEGL